jgi:hypothetical protein
MKRINTSRNFRGGRFLGKDAKNVSGLKNSAGSNYLVGPMGNVRKFEEHEIGAFVPEIYGDWVHTGYYSRELGPQHQFADMKTKYFSPKSYLQDIEVKYTLPGGLGLLFGPKNANYPMLSKAVPSKGTEEVQVVLNRLNTLMNMDGVNSEIKLIKLQAGDMVIENPNIDNFRDNMRHRPLTLTFKSVGYNKPRESGKRMFNVEKITESSIGYDDSADKVKQTFAEPQSDPMNPFDSNKSVGFVGAVDGQTIGYI